MFHQFIIKKENNYEFLKLFGLFFMVIDHVGYLLYPEYTVLRILGRIVLPLFMFQYLISFEKTTNRKKSLKLIWIFALISQIPFFLFQNARILFIKGLPLEYLNFNGSIFLSLAISYTMLYVCYELKQSKLVKFLLMIVLILITLFIPMDYYWFVPLTIMLMSIIKNHWFNTFVFAIMTIILVLLTNIVIYQCVAILVFLLAPLLYKIKMNFIFHKYFHYLFYPVHLFILFIIYLIFFK